MKKVAVVTDSNAGIRQKEAKELGIFVLPMPFTIDDQTYYEDINLTHEEFFEKQLNKILIYKNFSDALFQNSKSERLRSFNFRSDLTI